LVPARASQQKRVKQFFNGGSRQTALPMPRMRTTECDFCSNKNPRVGAQTKMFWRKHF